MADNSEMMAVTLKRDYVRDNVFILIIILLVQLGLIVALGGSILYQIQAKPKPIFFQATAQQQIIAPMPLEQPALSSAAILNWSLEAVRTTYTFNYHNIQNHFNKIAPYFDKRGLAKFLEVIASDPNMMQVKPDALIVSVQAREAPKIIKEGKVEGRYAWRIILPISIRYENSSIIRRQDIDVDLYIWRVSETEAPIGVKITNFNIEIKQGYTPQAAGVGRR